MTGQFPRKLSQLRRERGINQKTAAEKLGVSQALLSHYENGVREPGLDFVVNAAAYYEVSTDFLLGVSDDRRPGSEGHDLIHGMDFFLDSTKNADEKVKTSARNLMVLAVWRLLSTVTGAGETEKKYAALAMHRAELGIDCEGIYREPDQICEAVLEEAEELIRKEMRV